MAGLCGRMPCGGEIFQGKDLIRMFGKKKEKSTVNTETTAEEKTEGADDRITKDMLVTDALMLNPMVAPVLMQAGMYCFSCPASMGETIEEAAMVHGFDVDDILEAINSAGAETESA